MTRFRLPDGVPADNQTKTFSGGGSGAGAYAAPDMATPNYAAPSTEYSRVVVVVDDEEEEEANGVVVRKEEEDDDDQIVFPKLPMPWLVVGGVAAALVVLAYIVSHENVEPQPYCSQQPDWNQYNCIPG